MVDLASHATTEGNGASADENIRARLAAIFGHEWEWGELRQTEDGSKRHLGGSTSLAPWSQSTARRVTVDIFTSMRAAMAQFAREEQPPQRRGRMWSAEKIDECFEAEQSLDGMPTVVRSYIRNKWSRGSTLSREAFASVSTLSGTVIVEASVQLKPSTEVVSKSRSQSGERGPDRSQLGGGIAVLGGDGRLRVVDANTGEVVWRRRVLRAGEQGSVQYWQSVVGVTDSAGGLHVFDAATGRHLWEFAPALSSAWVSTSLKENFLVLDWHRHGPGAIVVVEPVSGREKWRREDEDRLGIDVADTMVIVRTKNRISAYDLESGQERWRYAVAGEARLRVAGLSAYLATRGVISALDLTTGHTLWSRALNDSRAVIAYADETTVIGMTDAELVRLAADDGTGAWSLNNKFVSVRVEPELNRTLAFPSRGQMRILDLAHGRQIAEVAPVSADQMKVVGRLCYSEMSARSVGAVDLSSGEVLWAADMPDSCRLLSHAGGVVLAVLGQPTMLGGSTRLRAIDAVTGQDRWGRETHGSVSLVAEGERAACFMDADRLFALELATGEVIWDLEVETPDRAACMPTLKFSEPVSDETETGFDSMDGVAGIERATELAMADVRLALSALDEF